ncbi:MAG: hypothetical protein EP335_07130 [Alphaproteobacteria bacterium]|nr:MAG: hypothetical protein EP335_07130 [Alphaproteobacteria bacterium]
MDSNELVVAYDYAAMGFRVGYFFPVFFGFMIVIQMIPLIRRRWFPGSVDAAPKKPRGCFAWLGLAFFWLAMVAVGSIFFGVAYHHHRSNVEDLSTGNYKVVEGIVENFQPMQDRIGSYESFTVAGVPFRYTEFPDDDTFSSATGFRNASIYGGPMADGIHVRIAYIDNVILRLEVEPAAMVGKKPNNSASLLDEWLADSAEKKTKGKVQPESEPGLDLSPEQLAFKGKFEAFVQTVMRFGAFAFQGLLVTLSFFSGARKAFKVSKAEPDRGRQIFQLSASIHGLAFLPIALGLISASLVPLAEIGFGPFFPLKVLLVTNVIVALGFAGWVWFRSGDALILAVMGPPENPDAPGPKRLSLHYAAIALFLCAVLIVQTPN